MSKNLKTPLSPDDVMKTLPDYFPTSVIEGVNNLLLKKYRGKSCTIKQNDIIEEILRIDNTLTKDKIFDEKYMDFESIFEKSGWKVTYDKPAYNENYDVYFEFEKKE